MFIVSVECAIERNHQFLVIKRPKNVDGAGMLSFPAGKVEVHDSAKGQNILMKAAKREVFEEVGLDLKDPLYYVSTIQFLLGEKTIPVIHTVFYCPAILTKLDVNISEREVDAYYWMRPEEILSADNCPDCMINNLHEISKLSGK